MRRCSLWILILILGTVHVVVSETDILTLYRVKAIDAQGRPTGAVLQLQGCPVGCHETEGAVLVPSSNTGSSSTSPNNANGAANANIGAGPANNNDPGFASPNVDPRFFSLQVLVQVIIGTSVTTTRLSGGIVSVVTSTVTQTATITQTIVNTVTGGAGGTVGPMQTSTTTLVSSSSPALFQNSSMDATITPSTSPSSLRSTSSPTIISSSTSSLILSSMSPSSLRSTSSPTIISSSTSSLIQSSSSPLLAILQAASATEFCSSFLRYSPTTTTISSEFTATNEITGSSTSTITNLLVTSSTELDVLTSTEVFTSVVSSVVEVIETSITSTILVSTSTSTIFTPALRKRQTQAISTPTGVLNNSPADISSACSQLVGTPTPSTTSVRQTTTVPITTSITTTQTSFRTTTGLSTSSSTLTLQTTTSTTTTSSTTRTVTSTSTLSTSTGIVVTAPNPVRRLGVQGATAGSSGCGPNADFVQFASFDEPPNKFSAVVPADGMILSASSFDFSSGPMSFEVLRPTTAANTFTLVFISPEVQFTSSRTEVAYVFQPFAVKAGDLLGVRTGVSQGGPCIYDLAAATGNTEKFRNGSGRPSAGDIIVTTNTFNRVRLNIQAIFRTNT